MKYTLPLALALAAFALLPAAEPTLLVAVNTSTAHKVVEYSLGGKVLAEMAMDETSPARGIVALDDGSFALVRGTSAAPLLCFYGAAGTLSRSQKLAGWSYRDRPSAGRAAVAQDGAVLVSNGSTAAEGATASVLAVYRDPKVAAARFSAPAATPPDACVDLASIGRGAITLTPDGRLLLYGRSWAQSRGEGKPMATLAHFSEEGETVGAIAAEDRGGINKDGSPIVGDSVVIGTSRGRILRLVQRGRASKEASLPMAFEEIARLGNPIVDIDIRAGIVAVATADAAITVARPGSFEPVRTFKTGGEIASVAVRPAPNAPVTKK